MCRCHDLGLLVLYVLLLWNNDLLRVTLRLFVISVIYRLCNRYCPINHLVDLRLPILRCLNQPILINLDRLWHSHNLDWPRGTLAFTPCIPSVMLNVDFQLVFDTDDFALERGRERVFQRRRIDGFFLIVLLLIVLVTDKSFQVMLRYIDLISSVARLSHWKSFVIPLLDEIIYILSVIASRIVIFVSLLAYKFAAQLETDRFDVLFAECVVNDYAHSGFLAQIVLVLVKDDLRSKRSCTKTTTASDITLHIYFVISGRVLYLWLLNEDILCVALKS